MDKIAALLLCLAVDHSDNLTELWRDRLMHQFIEDISLRGKERIGHDIDAGDFCSDRKGIECENQLVVGVTYYVFRYGNFYLGALPSSTRLISIVSCRQTFRIDTRSLPRRLMKLSLNDNAIKGSPDLSKLPEGLRVFSAWANKLNGPISLTSLPQHLEELKLADNFIKQPTVYYDNIPETIHLISLCNQGKHGRGIKEIRSVHPHRAIGKKSIFIGFTDETVQ